MGGKKKLSLKQMERAQAREDGKSEGKSKTKEPTQRKEKTYGIIPPNPSDDKIVKDLLKVKVLTPYTVATKLDLRISVAKHFLEDLKKRGLVNEVSSGRNLKIYTPAA